MGLHSVDVSPNPVQFYEKNNAGKITLYADNNEIRPYTVTVKINAVNVVSDKGKEFDFVISGHQKNVPVTVLKVTGQNFSYKYEFVCREGNLLNPKKPDNYLYGIPFLPNHKSEVTQGYLGPYSHKNAYALDFRAPEGTPIHAIRDGIVVDVKSDSNSGCAQPKCAKQANYIRILHSDETEALYAHLKYKGSKVKVGQQVRKGEFIGWSGKTGFVTSPHLHVEVLQSTAKGMKSIQTLFEVCGEAKSLEKGSRITCP